MENKVPNLLRDAAEAHRQNKLDIAEAGYREILEIAPETHEALFNLSQILIPLNKIEEAYKILKTANDLNPNDLLYMRELALVASRSGNNPYAGQIYSKILNIQPDNIESIIALGDLLLKGNHFLDAEERYMQAARLQPNDASMHIRCAYLFQKIQKTQFVTQAFEIAFKLDPGNNKISLELLRIYGINNDDEKIKWILNTLPNKAIVLELIKSARETNDLKDEVAIVKEYSNAFIKKREDEQQILLNKAEIFLKERRIEDVLEICTGLLYNPYIRPKTLNRISKLFFFIAKTRNALEPIKNYLEQSPTTPDSMLCAAQYHLSGGYIGGAEYSHRAADYIEGAEYLKDCDPKTFKCSNETFEHPPVTRPDYPSLPEGVERVLFWNSCGGIGETMVLYFFIQHYKKKNPKHITILYDGAFMDEYYEKPDYIDEVYQAGEGILAARLYGLRVGNYINDENIKHNEGVKLRDIHFTKIGNHLYNYENEHRIYPSEIEIPIHLSRDIIEGCKAGFKSLDLKLKETHLKVANAYWEKISEGKSMIVGIQARSNPHHEGTLQLPSEEYLKALTKTAKLFISKYNARILVCGDAALPDDELYESGDLINIDPFSPLFPLKLDIMRRTTVFLSSISGFSYTVNLLRTPSQIPAVNIFLKPETIRADHYSCLQEDLSSPEDIWLYSTFRSHDLLLEFYKDENHTPEKVVDFVEKLRHHTV